mgnify:CR=1 FL=1
MNTNTIEDKFILGGHEFTSRFILGSGKFSLELVKACVEKAGHRSSLWLCAGPMKADLQIFWIIFRTMSHCCQILPVPETPKKLCVLPVSPGNSAVVIL